MTETLASPIAVPKRRSPTMKLLIISVALVALAACGAETATTAATGAAIRKREMEEGKRTMERAQEKVGQAMEQAQRRGDKDGEK